MDVVLSGVIVALNIDQGELVRDIDWAEQQLAEMREDERSWSTLYSLLPSIPAEPRWKCASNLGLPAKELAEGLLHPSVVIAVAAANLIEVGAGGDEAKALVRDILDRGNDQTLHVVAELAPALWGQDAINILLMRLAKNLTLGCRWLLGKLPELQEDRRDGRILSALLRGLEADDSRIATAAANALILLTVDDLRLHAPELRRALRFWTRRGARCFRCAVNVHGGLCHRCHVVPISPRAGLVEALVLQ